VGLPQPPVAFPFELWIGISFLIWVEDSPVRGAVNVPEGFRIGSDGAGRLLPLLGARPHFGQPEPWWKWHDGLVRFKGSIVWDLDRAFRERWRLGGRADFRSLNAVIPAAPRGMRVSSPRVIKNEPSSQTNEIRETFLDRILAAERSIFIENPFLYHRTRPLPGGTGPREADTS
jgi:hypothetical protein